MFLGRKCMASKIKLNIEMNSKQFERTKSDNEKPNMMVGYCLKQILHFEGEFNDTLTSTGI